MTANNGVMAWKERLIQVLYIMVGLVIAFPILYALMISFMDPAQVLAGGVNLIPKKWTLENYRTALNSAPIMRFMWNSLILAATSSVVRVIVSALAAFAFAFLDFPCKNLIFMAMLATIMIPGGCSFSSKLPHGIRYGTDQYIPWYDDRIFRLSHEHFPVQTKL